MPIKKENNFIGWLLLIGWVIFVYAIAYHFHIPPLRKELSKQLPVQQKFEVIPSDFKARLRFHGLDKQMSVIEINNGKLYFYRNGKKCSF